MTLNRHALCGYPSLGVYKEKGIQPNSDDWDAYNFINALKGKEVKWDSQLTDHTGKTWRFRKGIGTASRTEAVGLFGVWGAQYLSNLGIKSGVLVPVPSSQQITHDFQCTARLMADAIAARSSSFTVAPILCFKVAKDADHGKRAAEGGAKPSRQSRDEIIGNLNCSQSKLSGNHILIDDVCTMGRHLLGCAYVLRKRGATVDLALCAAQTVWERPESTFKIAPENLEPPLLDLASLFESVKRPFKGGT